MDKSFTLRVVALNSFSRIIMIIISLTLMSCHDPSQVMRELDNLSTRHLELFLEQEQQWAEALKKQDAEKALLATDSMDAILSSFFQKADLAATQYTKEDSSLLHATINLWIHLQQVTDLVYPEIKALALLPKMDYTYRRDEQLQQILQHHDSLMQVKLQQLHDERERFWELKNNE